MNNDLFALASRKKFRYTTPQGQVSVEDLWDLPMSSARTNQANLDDIAIALDKQLKDSGTTTSFVKKTVKSNVELRAKFDIVLHVIEVKQAEADAAAVERDNANKKQRIMELIEQKKDADLAGKSADELQELLKNL